MNTEVGAPRSETPQPARAGQELARQVPRRRPAPPGRHERGDVKLVGGERLERPRGHLEAGGAGAKLIRRAGLNVELTAAGQRLAIHAAEGLAAHEALQRS